MVGRVAAVGRMVDMVVPAGRHYLKGCSLEYKSLRVLALGGQYYLTLTLFQYQHFQETR